MFKKSQIMLLGTLVMVNTVTAADIVDGEEFIDPTRPLFLSGSDGDSGSDVLAIIRNVIPSSYDISFIRAGNSPVAVINEERVTIGDVVGGATVVAIERSSVTLSLNGEERRISLYGDSIKRSAAQ
ncbi:MAG: hypothetical protein RL839_06675 [Gammaproteobacteria bacterium]